VGTIIKRPVSNAIWERSERPGDGFSRGPWDRAQAFPLRELAGEMPLVEFALRFTLSHPGVCTAIVGTTNPEHIEANVRVAGAGRLSDEMDQKARDAFRERFGA
jgi:aryl-alcohol dehydrogenase-like predicted oxidoreductase